VPAHFRLGPLDKSVELWSKEHLCRSSILGTTHM
jgi:hypothetical protein